MRRRMSMRLRTAQGQTECQYWDLSWRSSRPSPMRCYDDPKHLIDPLSRKDSRSLTMDGWEQTTDSPIEEGGKALIILLPTSSVRVTRRYSIGVLPRCSPTPPFPLRPLALLVLILFMMTARDEHIRQSGSEPQRYVYRQLVRGNLHHSWNPPEISKLQPHYDAILLALRFSRRSTALGFPMKQKLFRDVNGGPDRLWGCTMDYMQWRLIRVKPRRSGR
jgi:hypothetical protein